MFRKFIESRISAIRNFATRSDEIVIEHSEARNAVQSISQIVRSCGPFKNSFRMDISNFPGSEVRELLNSLFPEDLVVDVFWCSPKVGVSVSYREFVKFYDDIWFPSADDIWIVEHGVPVDDLKWILEFDHEEIITLRQKVVT